MSSGSSASHAALWSYAGSLYLTLGQFVLGVFLARILGPDELGLFIAVTAYTSLLLMAAQFGLPQAVLQARELSDSVTNAAFWTMCALALGWLALAVVVSRPLAALYSPDAFHAVFLLMSGTVLLMPYTALGLALLRRDMRFKEVARMEMLAFNVSGLLGLCAALAGAGVYSLVISGMAAMATNSVSLTRLLDWRPRRPGFGAVRGLLRYGRFVTINNAIGVSSSRVDNMFIGALLGTGALGLYNRAYSLARIPSDQFADSVGPLLLSSLARVQDDIALSRARWLKSLAAIGILTWPFLVTLGVIGPAAIELLYGSAWIGAGAPLQVMAVGAAFLVPASALRGLINAQGLVGELVPVNLWTLLFTVLAVVGCSPLGILGIAVGISLREILTVVLLARIARRSRLEILATDMLYALLPAMLASLTALAAGVAAILVLRAQDLSSALLTVSIAGTTVLLAYAVALLAMALLWRGHAPLAAVSALSAELLRRFLRR